ncbi:bifunctional DNA-formamidopyrimidine glycosylase/DNA-(apurinic or apyrimidinic site) lyase [Candidatus Berkelbacteria bacterium]|nr:bifunctional DNA-formamidopyrimidine glycosylase/DNA-(apurinic or apyrimidinic site) lyase [Candidatus Berkelbacteria bacterium]
MPELPEVEILRRNLEDAIVGKTIKDVVIHHRKIFKDDPEDIIGEKVQSVHRRAKLLYAPLSNGKSLVIHLKLTGQLIFTEDGPQKGGVVGGHPQKVYDLPPPHKHTHVEIEFTDGSHLYFNDLRKFGWMRVVDHGKEMSVMGNELGVEPLSKEFTVAHLQALAKRRPRMWVKQFLMAQSIIAGIGNIYSDEILYAARVHPFRRVKTITPEEWRDIVHITPKILKAAMAAGGTSFSAFRNLKGATGTFHAIAKAYHKEGKPCARKDGGTIERKKMGGRSAHYCPKCQK